MVRFDNLEYPTVNPGMNDFIELLDVFFTRKDQSGESLTIDLTVIPEYRRFRPLLADTFISQDFCEAFTDGFSYFSFGQRLMCDLVRVESLATELTEQFADCTFTRRNSADDSNDHLH